MKNNILTVWDSDKTAKSSSESTIYWSGYSNQSDSNTLPLFLEENSDQLRAHFLEFIHSLGELDIRGKRLIDHLEIDEGFSYWWMTLIAEKSYLKSPRIFDCLRLLALNKKLDEKNDNILFNFDAIR